MPGSILPTHILQVIGKRKIDTDGAIQIRKLRKDRQHNSQQENGRKDRQHNSQQENGPKDRQHNSQQENGPKDNNLQNIHIKLRIE